MSLVEDAALAASVVREAGALARRMRSEGLTLENKTSISDIVTAADRAAEALVVETLAAQRPADGVLGEEGSAHDGTSGRTWVIDPVDGTYNFVAGLDWWCSAIALLDGDELDQRGAEMLRGVDEMKIVAFRDGERRQHDDAHARTEEEHPRRDAPQT